MEEKKKYDQQELLSMEICLSMLLMFDVLTIDYIQRFSDMLAASGTPEGRERYNIVQPFAKDGQCRAMNGRLRKLISRFTSNANSLCAPKKDCPDFSQQISNSIEEAQEILDVPMSAYERFINYKLSRKTLSTPQDPVMLSIILKCIVFLDIAAGIYDNITAEANYPFLANYHCYKMLRMDSLHKQIVGMLSYMDFLDTNGKPLHYNLSGVKNCKESTEIIDDIIYIIYSAEYINRIFGARTGIYPDYGGGEYKSIVPRFDACTKPLSFYFDKYKDKYKDFG